MYKIIIYKLIIFKIKQNNNRIITKRYFKTIKTINNINIKDLSNKVIEYKKIYNDNCYIFSPIKENENDWYFEKLNEKSKKDYYNMIGGVLND